MDGPPARAHGRPAEGEDPVTPRRVVELTVGAPAHGGSCVARLDGRVVFVRHALPGERVRARITDGREGDRYWRADAIEVLAPSPHRVEAPCRYAGPGGCGGCDWQHTDLATQRRLKSEVVAEQLHRLAGLDLRPTVEAVPGAPDGSGWRTRVRFAIDSRGRVGMRRHRSHRIVPLSECFIAHPEVSATGVFDRTWPAGGEVQVTISGAGERAVIVGQVPEGRVVEPVLGRSYAVPLGGFWQVHPHAAATLVEAVRAVLEPRAGDVLLDLYAGAGLFAAALAPHVVPGGRVVAVESDPASVVAARDNLRGLPGVEVVADRVEGALAAGLGEATLVVADPPRTGLRTEVVAAIAARAPRRIAYVACDPATFARDLRCFAERGYTVAGLRAFDLFPHTHHVELLAALGPG